MVRTLASDLQTPGRHSIAWDGRDAQGSQVRKGMYFIHVRIGERARLVRVTFLQ
jgi:flagellar hook assembly protein FlgD